MKNQSRGRSPDGLGRWLRPTSASFGASNVVAINRDIVINEIMYEAAPSYPSNIYVGSGEEWVELFNRGTNPVNLTGWNLDNGVRYDFPTNTMLAPGAYLIVARDAAAMQAAHPGLTVLGLLDAGELLLDDVTVTELPGTAQARQLIQNGTFQGDTVGASPAACAQRAKPSGYSLWTARRSTP